MLTKLGKIIDLNTEYFKKELENIKNTQSKTSNSFSEILKNTLEGMKIVGWHRRMYMCPVRITEITKSEEKQFKKWKQLKRWLG